MSKCRAIISCLTSSVFLSRRGQIRKAGRRSLRLRREHYFYPPSPKKQLCLTTCERNTCALRASRCTNAKLMITIPFSESNALLMVNVVSCLGCGVPKHTHTRARTSTWHQFTTNKGDRPAVCDKHHITFRRQNFHKSNLYWSSAFIHNYTFYLLQRNQFH